MPGRKRKFMRNMGLINKCGETYGKWENYPLPDINPKPSKKPHPYHNKKSRFPPLSKNRSASVNNVGHISAEKLNGVIQDLKNKL